MKTTSTAINRLFGSTRSKFILLAIVIGVGHLLVYSTSCEACNSLFTSFRNKTLPTFDGSTLGFRQATKTRRQQAAGARPAPGLAAGAQPRQAAGARPGPRRADLPSLGRRPVRRPPSAQSSSSKISRQHLSAPDVHFLGDPRSESPGVERDLALLAACNHTIFDYGTYGFFAAFLAGGDMILADGVSEIESEEVTELREGKINATFIDGNGRVLPTCVRCS